MERLSSQDMFVEQAAEAERLLVGPCLAQRSELA